MEKHVLRHKFLCLNCVDTIKTWNMIILNLNSSNSISIRVTYKIVKSNKSNVILVIRVTKFGLCRKLILPLGYTTYKSSSTHIYSKKKVLYEVEEHDWSTNAQRGDDQKAQANCIRRKPSFHFSFVNKPDYDNIKITKISMINFLCDKTVKLRGQKKQRDPASSHYSLHSVEDCTNVIELRELHATSIALQRTTDVQCWCMCKA